jgi:hypothetical protein
MPSTEHRKFYQIPDLTFLQSFFDLEDEMPNMTEGELK